MRTIAIINQKGGCGKTTVAINLAACLARLGHGTLLVDMDPQGHCATGLAVPEKQVERTVNECLGQPPMPVRDAIWQIATKFDLLPSNLRLAGFEQQFAGVAGRELRLRQALEGVADNYDWCVLDCPPGVGLLTFNALCAADEVIVPVETGYFSLQGLGKMVETLEELRDRSGRDVLVRVLPTLYDTRTKLAREVLAELRGRFGGVLMRSCVNFNAKLKEAASFGQPITEYDPGSRGYKDFADLARELMGERPVSLPAPKQSDSLSRPAELVQRAKQLAQLSARQFGRPAAAAVRQPAPQAEPASLQLPPMRIAGTIGPQFKTPAPAKPTPTDRDATQRRLDAFYGTRRLGHEVEFVAHFPEATHVGVAGDFNGWDPVAGRLRPATDGRRGAWVARLPVANGRHRYRFVVDGRWVNDPHGREIEQNEFGDFNNVLRVA
jgi:chromosome partitioning protein